MGNGHDSIGAKNIFFKRRTGYDPLFILFLIAYRSLLFSLQHPCHGILHLRRVNGLEVA